MSELSKSSKRAISRPNAARALSRITAELTTLIKRSPEINYGDDANREHASARVFDAIRAVSNLYRKP